MSIGSLQLVRPLGLIVRDGCPSALQKRNLRQHHRAKELGGGFSGKLSNDWIDRSLAPYGWAARLWHDRHDLRVSSSTFAPAAVPQSRASALALAEQSKNLAFSAVNIAALTLIRGLTCLQGDPLLMKCAPAVALMAFSVWGLAPTMCVLRKIVRKKEEGKWSTSRTQHVTASYVRPLLLWIGVIVICRAFDPVVLASEASHVIKGRFINFVRSLSTVLAFAFCTASLTQQIQKTMLERQEKKNSRSLGVQFVGNTVYTSVWVAAVCLFMELLGFSTQKWITAGGFGTVLLTLAGREIFTNFLSSIMIHATRPFMENEWIQTKIEGQEVSGTVEHVGWWSPTVIRGDDREAVHIPNHKFTVSVVRNLSQKTHWRIKTHFGISHLDVGKVTDIVSDMRKVISKHPQVEQQRLHRRAFFDNIDPENQALLILVSCFVKTSHFEEYLRVKEVILLDLLRVISHHNARLATPIRSVQRIFDESEARQAPFRDVSSTPAERKGPLYMIEAAAVAVKDLEEGDSPKGDSALRSPESSKESVVKAVSLQGVQSVEDVSDLKSNTKYRDKAPVITDVSPKSGVSISSDTSSDDLSDIKSKTRSTEKVVSVTEAISKPGGSTSSDGTSQGTSTIPQLEGLDSMGLNSNNITLLKAAFEKPPADVLDGRADSGPDTDAVQGEKVGGNNTTEQQKLLKPENSSPIGSNETSEQLSSRYGTEKSKMEQLADDPWKEHPQVLVQSTMLPAPPKPEIGPSGSRSLEEKGQTLQGQGPTTSPATTPVPRLQSVEENLVLGVALDGPKRTLPLDDDIPVPARPRELVTSRNGSSSTTSKDRRDQSSNSKPNPSGSASFDGRDRDR